MVLNSESHSVFEVGLILPALFGKAHLKQLWDKGIDKGQATIILEENSSQNS